MAFVLGMVHKADSHHVLIREIRAGGQGCEGERGGNGYGRSDKSLLHELSLQLVAKATVHG